MEFFLVYWSRYSAASTVLVDRFLWVRAAPAISSPCPVRRHSELGVSLFCCCFIGSPLFFPSTRASRNMYPAPLPYMYESAHASQQSTPQQCNKSSSTVTAVYSPNRGAPEFFADIQFGDTIIKSSLLDTGAFVSMLPMRTLSSILNPPSLENFR